MFSHLKCIKPKFDYFLILLLLVLLLGTFLGSYRLGYRSLWADESCTQLDALRPLSRTLSMLFLENSWSGKAETTPLIPFLIQRLALLFGTSEFIVRLPAFIFGVFSLIAIYFAGKALRDRNMGILAALILSVTPAFISYTHESRFYTIYLFFSILCLLFLIRIFRYWTIRDINLFIFCNILILYTHAISVVFLICESTTLLLFILFQVAKKRISFPSFKSRSSIVVLGVLFYLLFQTLYSVYLKIYLQTRMQSTIPVNFKNFFYHFKNVLFFEIPPLYFEIFIGLCLLGLLLTLFRRPSFGVLCITTIFILSYYLRHQINETFGCRYIIFIVPLFSLLVSFGMIEGFHFLIPRFQKTYLTATICFILFLYYPSLAIYLKTEPSSFGCKGTYEYLSKYITPGDVILWEDFITDAQWYTYSHASLFREKSLQLNILTYGKYCPWGAEDRIREFSRFGIPLPDKYKYAINQRFWLMPLTDLVGKNTWYINTNFKWIHEEPWYEDKIFSPYRHSLKLSSPHPINWKGVSFATRDRRVNYNVRLYQVSPSVLYSDFPDGNESCRNVIEKRNLILSDKIFRLENKHEKAVICYRFPAGLKTLVVEPSVKILGKNESKETYFTVSYSLDNKVYRELMIFNGYQPLSLTKDCVNIDPVEFIPTLDLTPFLKPSKDIFVKIEFFQEGDTIIEYLGLMAFGFQKDDLLPETYLEKTITT